MKISSHYGKGAAIMKKVPEYWLDVPGSSKYQVSNYGNFRKKLKNEKFRDIVTYIRKGKWMAVKVDFNGRYAEYIVHKIVADVFLDSPSPGQVLYHKNGLIRDNYAGNLEYEYPKKVGEKTGGNSRSIPVLQIDPTTNKVINFYKSIAAAARDNFIHKETISMVIRGKLKTASGYKWRRELIDDIINL